MHATVERCVTTWSDPSAPFLIIFIQIVEFCVMCFVAVFIPFRLGTQGAKFGSARGLVVGDVTVTI